MAMNIKGSVNIVKNLTVGANLQTGNQGLLKLADVDGTNFINLQAPSVVSTDVTLVFPATAGTNGQVLTTNGSGTLSWTNVGGSGTVTSVAVSGANGIGVSGSPITGAGTISLSLGAITPTTVNGLTLTANATGFSIAGGTTSKTLTVGNTLTFAGTDATTITFQGTDTYVGRATTDTFSNKTFNAGTSGNVLQLSGTAISSVTGSGAVVLATSPTLTSPALGAATATSITLASDPSSAMQAATKQYVDNVATGLDFKQSVRVATTANINLSSAPSSIDGVTLTSGDRVLVKDQTTASQNGIYIFNGSGSAMTRSTDADSSAEVTAGMYCFVEEGPTNCDCGWVLSTDNPITLGTTNLTFTQFTGLGQVTAGTGLSKAGNTISIDTGIIPTSSSNLGFFASTTSAQLKAVISDEVGSGALVFATSPTLVTPTLGAASATSINGLIITSTTGTFTLASGKSLTVNNSLTLSATDGATLNIGSGGTLGSAAYTASTAYEVPLTFSTGLTRTTNTITVNTTQNIAKLSNLTTNGFVKTGSSDGTLSVDTTAYAPLASPALTGTPTAPTAATGTNTTQIATTAYVVNTTAKYVQTFNATTDWGTASGGVYTITVASGTHGKAYPNIRVEELISTDYFRAFVDDEIVRSTGNVEIKVSQTPDGRFAGRVIIF